MQALISVSEHQIGGETVNAVDAREIHGAMCIANAAKALQVGPKALFRWLSGHQWIYRRAGGSFVSVIELMS